MMKTINCRIVRLVAVLSVLIVGSTVMAQTGYTNVTGTIAAYANGSVVANWVNNSASPINPNLNGASFPRQAAGNMDASGNFALRLADIAVVQPGGSTWNITACAKGGSQPVCQTASIAVTGTSMSVSSSFASAPLPQNTIAQCPQHTVAQYPGAGTNAGVGCSNITTDSTGNNLTVPGSLTLAGIATAPILNGTLTLTTATSDAATITGVTASSKCVFSPTNATAAAATTIAYISAVGTNSVTITHVATTASGGTLSLKCSLN